MGQHIGAVLLLVFAAACGGLPPVPSGPPTPTPTPDPELFNLRAWQTQALPPRHTFSWLPMLEVGDLRVIDGNVEVPAIFPGPLLVFPNERTITPAGVNAIIDEASRLGILTGGPDFTGNTVAPGARAGNIEMFIGGVSHYELTGNPDLDVRCDGARCHAPPGSPEAFAGFWRQLSVLDAWIPAELGAPRPYQPERVALLLIEPQVPEPGLEQPPINWPLDGSLDEAGVAFPGDEGLRCLQVETDDLTRILPFLRAANQLTVFVDAAGNERSAIARVIVPGEDPVCPTGG